ncbi:MAG: NIPSNAP family protein [Pseudohongiellaceae bacterium]
MNNKIITTVGRPLFFVLAVAALFQFTPGGKTIKAQDSSRVFELRTYTATPGNLDKLHARFRDHTTRIFEKHGMTVVAYWTPTDAEAAQDTLIYVLAHDSQEAADASWRAFGQDPEWRQVSEASNADGSILAGVERVYMTATDFSPMK